MQIRSGILGVLVITSLAASTQNGQAQSAWTNTVNGGNWSVAGNWSPSAVPGPGTNVFLTNSVTVSYSSTNDLTDEAIANLTIINRGASGSATLVDNATGFNPTGDTIIGQRAVFDLNGFSALFGGSLTISNLGSLAVRGGTLTNNGDISFLAGSSIFITNNGTLQAGATGLGTVTNGGIIRLDDGGALLSGTVTNSGTIQSFNGAGLIGGFVYNTGTVIVTNNATLSLSGGGRNASTITLGNGAVLNIGGTTASAANLSAVTFTNAVGATIFPAFFTPVGSTVTINASTNGVGILNQGTIGWNNGTENAKIYLNASVINAVGGWIGPSPSPTLNQALTLTIQAFPTNFGTVAFQFKQNLVISNGNFVNSGIYTNMNGGNTLTIVNGSFINEGFAHFRDTGQNLNLLVDQSTLNDVTGLMVIDNTDPIASVHSMGGTMTNYGTIQIYRPSAANGGMVPAFTLSGSLFNTGMVMAIGPYGNLMTNTLPANYLTFAITNAVGGTIISTNGSVLGLTGAVRNLGTLEVETNSAMGIGVAGNARSQVNVGGVGAVLMNIGSQPFINEGTITLNGGVFGTSLLTLSNNAVLQGNGQIGTIVFDTAWATGTGYVVTVKNVLNSGSIKPNGTLNVLNITNLSGGTIIGSGVIESLNTTNTGSGTAFGLANGKILNNPGATILASGGLLVLSNGFVNNTQAGTVGITNGGTLQIGDGTFAFTNNGVFAVLNGASYNPSSSTVPLGSGVMQVAGGGVVNFSNGTFTVGNTVSNIGTINVVNSRMTYQAPVVISGKYTSDPSTNTFTSNMVVTASGTMSGGAGDLFDFKRSLLIQSTNNIGFDLALSTVAFSGGGAHTNAVTGGDFGTNVVLNANFAYGTLTLASATDDVYFVSGGFTNGLTANNALYVTQLNLFDNGGLLQSNLVTHLHSSFNIYYQSDLLNPGNTYLANQTFSLDGGGLLTPFVPEPSTLGLVTLAVLTLVARRNLHRK